VPCAAYHCFGFLHKRLTHLIPVRFEGSSDLLAVGWNPAETVFVQESKTVVAQARPKI
jgi:hypothetical protein